MACLISFPTGLVVLRVYDEDIRGMKRTSGNAVLKFRQARVKMKGTVDPVHIELNVCGPDEGVMPIFNTITGCIEIEINPSAIKTRRGANLHVGRLQVSLPQNTMIIKETAASVRAEVTMPTVIPPMREAIQKVTSDEALTMPMIRLYLVHYNPAILQRTVEQLVESGQMTEEDGEYRWCSEHRHGRASFRDLIRDYLVHNGGYNGGVARDEIIEHFEKNDVRKVKITIALNELLSRREAVYRAGVYRLINTSAVSAQ